MEKRPFLIDCDTGTDDAIAIMAALYSPQIDIQAITSVNGNVAEVYTSRNNLDLMEYLGKDIPVARGAVRALQGGGINAEGGAECHGEKGLGTIQLPTAQRAFDPRVADQVIYDTAVKCKGELELLVIGPMTNIAIALCNHLDLAGLIKRIWFMGGAGLSGRPPGRGRRGSGDARRPGPGRGSVPGVPCMQGLLHRRGVQPPLHHGVYLCGSGRAHGEGPQRGGGPGH